MLKKQLTRPSQLMRKSIRDYDPVTNKRISTLGLADLNRLKGWGNDFHKGFVDLNPYLNPTYKFQHRKRVKL